MPHSHLIERLDCIASEIEQVDPRIALAMDKVSDKLEGRKALQPSLQYKDLKNKPSESGLELLEFMKKSEKQLKELIIDKHELYGEALTEIIKELKLYI